MNAKKLLVSIVMWGFAGLGYTNLTWARDNYGDQSVEPDEEVEGAVSRADKPLPAITKVSDTGHTWTLVGDGGFWKEPETGYIYSPRISEETIRKFQGQNKITYKSHGERYPDYQKSSKKYCESKTYLGLAWTTPSGVPDPLDTTGVDFVDKQFNIAETHGIRSIFYIRGSDKLWSRSPNPDYHEYALHFSGYAAKVVKGYRGISNADVICVSQ